MQPVGLRVFLLLLVLACAIPGADRTTITKDISASSGPWVVTLSINLGYPYGGMPGTPAVFSASDGFAFQAGDVLTIAYNSGLWCAVTYVSEQTCVDANGYRIYGPVDNNPVGTSTVYAPSKYMDPATYPIYLMQLVATFADTRGQIVGVPFKVGNGPVTVTVPAGASGLQLGANLWDYTTARDYYTGLKVTVSGPAPATMKSVGSMAQLAVGGNWKTTFVLENSGSTSALARLKFFDDGGNALPLPLSFPQSPSSDPMVASTLDKTLAAGAALTIVSSSLSGPPTQVGWAQLISDGSVSGFAVFGLKWGNYDQEAVVPLETRSSGGYVLWFDNTEDMVVGAALANISTQAVTVAVTIRDESGLTIGTDTVVLPAQGHTAFELPKRFAQTIGRRGTVEFQTTTSGQISVLGLRFNPIAFTSIPVMAK
jgi:hypothetical protein